MSPLGFATEDGFTDDPSAAIQLVDLKTANKRIAESGRTDLVPWLVTFELHGEIWQPITS